MPDDATGTKAVLSRIGRLAAADHDFVEDVADASMCRCGVPALVHHLVEPK